MSTYDLSKRSQATQYFSELLQELNGAKVAGVYARANGFSFVPRYRFVLQHTPLFIAFDNGKSLVLEFSYVDELRAEYRAMTVAEQVERESDWLTDYFNFEIESECDFHSVHLAYDSLSLIRVNSLHDGYSKSTADGAVDWVEATDESFDTIEFVMQNGKSFSICADFSIADVWVDGAEVE